MLAANISRDSEMMWSEEYEYVMDGWQSCRQDLVSRVDCSCTALPCHGCMLKLSLPTRLGPGSNFRYHFGLCLLAGPSSVPQTGTVNLPPWSWHPFEPATRPWGTAKQWRCGRNTKQQNLLTLDRQCMTVQVQQVWCAFGAKACNDASRQAFTTLHWRGANLWRPSKKLYQVTAATSRGGFLLFL